MRGGRKEQILENLLSCNVTAGSDFELHVYRAENRMVRKLSWTLSKMHRKRYPNYFGAHVHEYMLSEHTCTATFVFRKQCKIHDHFCVGFYTKE